MERRTRDLALFNLAIDMRAQTRAPVQKIARCLSWPCILWADRLSTCAHSRYDRGPSGRLQRNSQALGMGGERPRAWLRTPFNEAS